MTPRRFTPNFNQPTDYLIGHEAIYRTYEGDELIGTIESFDGARAIIRFDNGGWAYSNYELELVG